MLPLQRFINCRLKLIVRKFILIIPCLSLIILLVLKSKQPVRNTSLNGNVPYKAFVAEIIPHKVKREESKKYLSYQPPAGGWNNQRIAFENAVIMAAMLNRTLLVQPLGPHDRMLNLKMQYNQSAGYEIYNMVPTKELVPISKLIDLERLASFLPVREITSNHNHFINEFNITCSWYRVCHNGLARAWIDKIPVRFKRNVPNFITYIPNFKKRGSISKYRQFCPEKIEHNLAVWEFLPELRKRNEDMIYFEQGSLFVRSLFFTDYQRALTAQRALIDWIKPAPKVLYNVERIINSIGKPFNALHVRRNDHKTGQSLNIQYWVLQLAKANALKHSNILYIATDETNLAWFSSLKHAGYRILFANDFEIFRQIHKNNLITGKDVIGFHEQVICSHAKIFIESYYSTFSLLIERYRQARRWNKKQFQKFIFSSVEWLNTDKL